MDMLFRTKSISRTAIFTNTSLLESNTSLLESDSNLPLVTKHKLNVHETFRRYSEDPYQSAWNFIESKLPHECSGNPLKVLSTYFLCPGWCFT